jgi:hypothetical protein
MPFDLSQILIASCAVTAFQSAIMLALWTRHRDATWLPWRAAIFVLGGGFLFLFVIDDPSLRQVSIGLGTATFIAATFAVWSSARVFTDKPVVWPALIAALGIWAGLSVLTDTLDWLLPATIVQSLAGIGWIGGGALEHWRAQESGRGTNQWGAIAIYGIVALFFALRLPLVLLMPFPFGARPVNGTWLTVFVLVLDVAAILLTTVTLVQLRNARSALQRERPEVLG